MDVTVYGVAGSPNVQAVLLCLAEKSVPYALSEVSPPFKSADHLTRNPFGRVPVLEHDGFTLYETQAILRYVDQVFEGSPLEPVDAQPRARMNQILGIIDCYLFPSWSGTIGFERLIAPTFFGRPPDLAVVEAAVPLARCCAEALVDLSAEPWLTGDCYSLADIRLLPHFNWLRQTPEGQSILAGKSRLNQWFDRAAERPAARSVLASQ